MKAEPKTRSRQTQEITVESDRFTTVGAVAFLIVCGLLLVREIDHFIWGHFSGPVHIQTSFWSIWGKVSEAMAAICCFVVAFEFPNNSVKIASLLVGVDVSGSVLLSCLHTSPDVLHTAAVSGSAVRQVALAIFCVALARWLRSVVHRGRPSELPGGES